MTSSKIQTIDQVIFQIMSEPQAKAKLKLPAVWPKVRPFLLMIATILGPKVSVYTNAFIDAIDSIIAGAKAPIKVGALWIKVKPFAQMAAGLFGKKVAVYINTFIALIDKIVAGEDA